jgi:hypothetical protein
MPFFDQEDNNSSARKWQCFVCGKQFELYEEFTAHIIEAHDEGREYICCPACNAPVRDMRFHYKAKHPNRLIPKNTQLRVTVWNDFKKGKKKTRKPKTREGFFASNKMGVPIHYRSGYECDVYELLEEDRDIAAYYAEPFKVPYCYKGEWHDYLPDIKLQYMDGTVDIWEIKPATQTSYGKNKAKWAAMNEYAKNMGWNFTVITEVGIDKLRTKIKQQKSSLLNEDEKVKDA